MKYNDVAENPKREVIEKWVAALESGEYEQATGVLRRFEDFDGRKAGFCCLGVLCDLAVKEGVITETILPERSYAEYGEHFDDVELPDAVVSWAGLSSTCPWIGGRSLVSMNDVDRRSFAEIAEHIRASLL